MFSIPERGYAKVQGNTRWCFFGCKLMQSATQPFLVSSRNVCGEECCVTMLKTTVQQTKTDDCFKVFEKGVISFMSQTWDKEKKGKSLMGWKPLTSQSTARVSNRLPVKVGRNQSCQDQERITYPFILSLVRTQWTSCSFSPANF